MKPNPVYIYSHNYKRVFLIYNSFFVYYYIYRFLWFVNINPNIYILVTTKVTNRDGEKTPHIFPSLTIHTKKIKEYKIMEEIVHNGIKGVFFSEEDWTEIYALFQTNKTLLNDLRREYHG